ncbi:ras-related protein Rab-8B isoform X1 [Procambarus clarkii]|uniref:ras-related protein Rab-8B isoform X1 n=2 Tax=Procambarus clarkii TaxID=6728 RepID=UPI0037440780
MSRPYHYFFKVVLIGDAGVGKSSLLTKFEEDTSRKEPFVSTIGFPFRVRDVKFGRRTVRLQLWEAGWDTPSATSSDPARGPRGVLLVYDVTHETSYDSARRWLWRLREQGGFGKMVVMLLGNKGHYQGDDRQVTWQRGKELADEAGIKFLEVSDVTGTNIEQALVSITSAILAKETNVISSAKPSVFCSLQ